MKREQNLTLGEMFDYFFDRSAFLFSETSEAFIDEDGRRNNEVYTEICAEFGVKPDELPALPRNTEVRGKGREKFHALVAWHREQASHGAAVF